MMRSFTETLSPVYVTCHRFHRDSGQVSRSIRSVWRPVLAAAALLTVGLSPVQAQLAPVNGMRPADLRAHAIVDATVIPAPGQKIEHATIVIRNGVIEAVGPKDTVSVPIGARVWSGEGMTVYAGLIESALLVAPGSVSTGAGSHWNTRIRPEVSMVDQPAPDAALRKDLRAMGFTAAAVYPSTGAMRGSGVLLALADETQHVLAYRDKIAMAMAFDYGGGGGRRGPGAPPAPTGETPQSGYPSSLMGGLALVRQALHDAKWHAECTDVWTSHPQGNEPPLRADALEALGPVLSHSSDRQQVLFDAPDELNELRAAKLAREFDLDMILLGCGTEFRQLDAVLATKLPIIVPLEFPRRPDASTLSAADSLSLRDLMTWEQAPTNPRRLVRGTSATPGANIALTTHRLRARNDFHSNLRTAIKHGLTEDEALAALTTTPAKMLGVENVMGTIENGKAANLVVVKGSLFSKDAKIYDTWVNGRHYEVNKDATVQLKGSGTIKFQSPIAQIAAINGKELTVDIDTVKSTVTLHLPDKKKVAAKKVVAQADQISFVTDGRPFEVEGYVRYSGVIEGQAVTGTGAMPDGSEFQFSMTIQPKAEGEKEPEDAKTDEKPEGSDEAKTDESSDEKPEADAAKNDAAPKDAVTGEWSVRFDMMPDAPSIPITLKLEDGNKVSGSVSVMGQAMEISNGKFDPATGKLAYSVATMDGGTGTTEATIAGNSMTGIVTSAAFTSNFSGTREGAASDSASTTRESRAKKEEEKFVMPPEELNYPLGEYGRMSPPQQQDVVLVNATIWTSGPQGVIKNGWMKVSNGKIESIGSGTYPGSPQSISSLFLDLQGKHITPGLIDCHSHTGINGSVNEGAQTNSAECRIADCIDPTAINWYRQLAGGLTACNQLHGSANPIGGQNSVVKLKWSAAGGPEAFPITDAIPGIKFALGENVKRSSGRYPNTRMGVETFIRDAFTAAKEYKEKWNRHLALPTEARERAMPPQRDLELDTLVEILEGKRIVHCHSYRQDEILMLIRVADDFGFKIGTFQHVLEGFKVAEAIGRHGAGASSFSDWWAYKVEVMDAIPYNGTLMNNVGVLVSFNSDSDELARRMNWEAAKAVRYGGMDPAEALKFVTINPAKQLRIDHRTGSLEKGKDADFAIWSGDPLSVYSKCEQTWVEGARYFDLTEDQEFRKQIHTERERLIQKVLALTHGDPAKPGAEGAREGGEGRPEGGERPGGGDRPRRRPPTPEALAWFEEQVRLGRDPEEVRPGECGCGLSEHE